MHGEGEVLSFVQETCSMLRKNENERMKRKRGLLVGYKIVVMFPLSLFPLCRHRH